jgi:hypothetical protein
MLPPTKKPGDETLSAASVGLRQTLEAIDRVLAATHTRAACVRGRPKLTVIQGGAQGKDRSVIDG